MEGSACLFSYIMFHLTIFWPSYLCPHIRKLPLQSFSSVPKGMAHDNYIFWLFHSDIDILGQVKFLFRRETKKIPK